MLHNQTDSGFAPTAPQSEFNDGHTVTTDRESAPKGFTVLTADPTETVIEYRSHGMGCILFFIGFAILWIGGISAFIFVSDHRGFVAWLTLVWQGSGWAKFALLGGASGLCYFSCFLLFHLFGVTTFTLRPDGLAITKRLFGLSWTHHVLQSELQFVEQLKDGGEGEDSFPSWALAIQGHRRHYLLKRQQIEKSDWLGSEIAKFFQLEFRPCRQRT